VYPHRKFIAIGKVIDDRIKTVTQFHRMKLKFLKYNEIPIQNIISKLKFIKNLSKIKNIMDCTSSVDLEN